MVEQTSNHGRWSNCAVKCFCTDQAQRNAGLFQGLIVRQRMLGNPRSLVVTDGWNQSGDEHEGALDVFFDRLLIGCNPIDAMISETFHPHGKKLNRMNDVRANQRHERVELKLPLHPAQGRGQMVADDLRGDHCQHLNLSRIDFAGHDRTAGLVRGQRQLRQPRSRTRGKQAEVVSDLVQRDR